MPLTPPVRPAPILAPILCLGVCGCEARSAPRGTERRRRRFAANSAPGNTAGPRCGGVIGAGDASRLQACCGPRQSKQRGARCDSVELGLIGSVRMIGACIQAYIAGCHANKARTTSVDLEVLYAAWRDVLSLRPQDFKSVDGPNAHPQLTLRKSDATLTVVVPARANQGNAVRASDPGRAGGHSPPPRVSL